MKYRSIILAACVLASAAHAQNYPNRAITIVVPLAAGDAADTATRAMAEELTKSLRTPILIVNRPGAGGALATESVVKAQKDGYTILLAQNGAVTFRPVMEPKTVPYDAGRDLAPLGLAARTPSVLAVRSDAPYRTFKELVEFAKKNPGAVRVGTPGTGSVGDFCIQLINQMTEAQLVSVPFNGASPAVTALRGGHIDGVVIALGALGAHIRSGALRGLVISSRFPDFPDIPTMAELGFEQDIFGVWLAYFAPAAVPAEVSNALIPAIEQAVRSAAISARLLPLGIMPDYAAPEKLAAEIRREYQTVQAVARKSGLVR